MIWTCKMLNLESCLFMMSLRFSVVRVNLGIRRQYRHFVRNTWIWTTKRDLQLVKPSLMQRFRWLSTNSGRNFRNKPVVLVIKRFPSESLKLIRPKRHQAVRTIKAALPMWMMQFAASLKMWLCLMVPNSSHWLKSTLEKWSKRSSAMLWSS